MATKGSTDMLTHLLSTRRFREPRVWSVGMGSIAVVMLLMTYSQAGSLPNNPTDNVKSTQVYTVSNSVAPVKVHQLVPEMVVEQPGVSPRDDDSQFGGDEPLLEPESVEVTDSARHQFLQYVRQARLAKRIDNSELSASLVKEAQAVLFGSEAFE